MLERRICPSCRYTFQVDPRLYRPNMICLKCARYEFDQDYEYPDPKPQHPAVPDPEPNIEPSSCDMFGHMWILDPEFNHQVCERCGVIAF